jgi:hypothetical protein
MEFLDLTGRMIGVTMTDRNLKSFMGLDPEFPLREGGIYQAYGKVVGNAPVGFWLELHWIGRPKPPGGKQHFDHGPEHPALLMQWERVITMALHETDPDEAWLAAHLDGLRVTGA